jgi:hypothetical protein
VPPAAQFVRSWPPRITAICVGICAAMAFGISCASARAQESRGESRVALTASVEKQEYCLQPDGRTNLRMALRLEFRNVSRGKILISQKSSTVDGMDIVDLASGNQPYPWPHITIDRTFPKTDAIVPASPGEEFAVLKPGKTMHSNAVVHVDLLHSKLPGGGLVNPGKYSVAVTVATWLDSDTAAAAARTQWHGHGYLISDDVTSAPVNFSVSANPQFRDCGYRE